MTKDEVNIKIAESLGWISYPHSVYGFPLWHHTKHGEPKNVDLGLETEFLPNFYEDLNACASFEATLTYEEKEEYVNLLINPMSGLSSECDACFSTAPQRCRAYLTIKGLYTP